MGESLNPSLKNIATLVELLRAAADQLEQLAKSQALPESSESQDYEAKLAAVRAQYSPNELGMSIRARKALIFLGCRTLQDASRLTRSDLARVRNCGKRTIREIEQALAKCRLYFAKEQQDVDG